MFNVTLCSLERGRERDLCIYSQLNVSMRMAVGGATGFTHEYSNKKSAIPAAYIYAVYYY